MGYPPPPSNGSWQTDLRSATPLGIDGPQWVLEHWSDLNNVFQFVRVEDIAYDKRPGMGNVVYIADSGRGRTAAQSLDTPNFRSTNGRVWKMVLDKKDPKQVNSLTVFVEGDDNPVKTPNEIHQPDNLESTRNGILVTEDPGSSQQFPRRLPDRSRTPRRRGSGTCRSRARPASEVAARVNQSADGGPTRRRRAAPRQLGRLGVDRHRRRLRRPSAADMFLINIQAHTLWIEKAPGDDNYPPAGPDFTYKREGGQLLLIKIPGG